MTEDKNRQEIISDEAEKNSPEQENPVQEKELSQQFADNLKRLCEEKGINPAELSKRTGLPNSTISLIRSGKSDVKLKFVVKFAEVLNVSTDELIYGRKPEYMNVENEIGLTGAAIEELIKLKKISDRLNYEGHSNSKLECLNAFLLSVNDQNSVLSKLSDLNIAYNILTNFCLSFEPYDYADLEKNEQGLDKAYGEIRQIQQWRDLLELSEYQCAKAFNEYMEKKYKINDSLTESDREMTRRQEYYDRYFDIHRDRDASEEDNF